jgi:hypothetical protein
MLRFSEIRFTILGKRQSGAILQRPRPITLKVYNCSNGLYSKSGGDHLIFRYNYLHDNYSSIDVSTNSHYQTNVQIYHNVIVNFTGWGIFLGATDDNMSNQVVYNNTVYTTKTAAEGAMATSEGGFSSTGWQFYNNIFQGIGSDYSGAVVRYAPTAAASTIDYNNYGGNFNVLCGSTKTNLTQLLAATCCELTSGSHDQHSIAAAPVFTNRSGHLNQKSDFALAPNSPGYRAGSDGQDMGAHIGPAAPPNVRVIKVQ